MLQEHFLLLNFNIKRLVTLLIFRGFIDKLVVFFTVFGSFYFFINYFEVVDNEV